MGEEFAERRAEIIVGTGIIGIPIPFAAAKTEAAAGTCGTFCRVLFSLCEKFALLFPLEELFERLLADFPEFPFVETVEIAGVKGAVALHNEIRAAASAGGTGSGRHPHRKMDIIIKQTDAGIASVFPVKIPFIEQTAEEPCVEIRRQ